MTSEICRCSGSTYSVSSGTFAPLDTSRALLERQGFPGGAAGEENLSLFRYRGYGCPGPTRTEFFSSASISDVWLTRFLPMQSAAKVARIGWDAMKSGKGVMLTGPMHSLVAFSSRFQPRALQARMNALSINRILPA